MIVFQDICGEILAVVVSFNWSFLGQLSTSLVPMELATGVRSVCSDCSIACQVSERLLFCVAPSVESCNNQVSHKVELAQLSGF